MKKLILFFLLCSTVFSSLEATGGTEKINYENPYFKNFNQLTNAPLDLFDPFKYVNAACAIPTGLTVSNITGNSAVIKWMAVDGADNYEVEVEDGKNTPAFAFNRELSATSVKVTGLSEGGQYKVKVKTKCSGGNNSDYTEWVFFNASTGGGDSGSGSGNGSGPVNTACAAPGRVVVSNITGTGATIRWQAVDGADNYEVEVEDGENTPAFTFNRELSATSVEVTGLAEGGQYKVKVKTKCSGGNNSDYTEWVFFTTAAGESGSPNSCGMPNNLTVSVVTDSSAMIRWTGIRSVKSYIVQFETVSRPKALHFKIQTATTRMSVLDLQPNTRYRFRVRTSCSDEVSSSNSAWYEFQTPSKAGLSFGQLNYQPQVAELELYPNPASREVKLAVNDLLAGEIKEIEVFSLTGKLMKTIRQPDFAGNTTTIDISQLQTGIYFVRVRSGDSGIKTVRLVVSR